MLWPPPKRGERVKLACGCAATVTVAMPVVFMYLVRIWIPEKRCHRSHRMGAVRLVGLETLQAVILQAPSRDR